MRLIERLQARTFLNRLARETNDAEEIYAIRRVLDDRALFEDAVGALADQHDSDLATSADGGRILNFLEWLVEHQDQILAFIKALVGIFTGLDVKDADPRRG